MRKAAVLLSVALLAILVCLPGVARAHASYKSSEPADRSSVSSPPDRVTAEFTEPLAGGSYLQVTDPCGTRVDGGDVSMVGYEMTVSMSGSRSGTYSVFYRAHSQLDPHVVEGTFSFGVTSGEPCASEQDDPAPSERQPSDEPGAGDGASDADPAVNLAQGASGGGGGEIASRNERSRRSATADRSSPPPGREPTSARVPNLAAPESDDERRPSVYDGIPMRPFLVSLLLAALIGAAGGKIYAGIMGPRA